MPKLPKTLYVFEESDSNSDTTYFVADRTLDDVAPGVGETRIVGMYELKAVVKATTETKATPIKR